MAARTVRFYSIHPGRPFRTVRTAEFPDAASALAAVVEHATAAGYSNVREVSDDDGYSSRYTATTPGGRHGRNVAAAEIGDVVDFEAEP